VFGITNLPELSTWVESVLLLATDNTAEHVNGDDFNCFAEPIRELKRRLAILLIEALTIIPNFGRLARSIVCFLPRLGNHSHFCK